VAGDAVRERRQLRRRSDWPTTEPTVPLIPSPSRFDVRHLFVAGEHHADRVDEPAGTIDDGCGTVLRSKPAMYSASTCVSVLAGSAGGASAFGCCAIASFDMARSVKALHEKQATIDRRVIVCH
jgi:hypothetical protein